MIFTVFSKESCPYCVKVAQLLKLAEVKHVIYKLNEDYTRQEFYKTFGAGSTFPQVRVCTEGEEWRDIGGCSETVTYLKENNLV